MKQMFFTIAVFCAISAIYDHSVQAQSSPHWKKIGQLDYGCQQVIFWNENNGLASCQNDKFPIVYYYNGTVGQWNVSKFTPALTSMYYECRFGDIFMSDSLNGFVQLGFLNDNNYNGVSTDSLYNLYGLWQTHNGGRSWSPTKGHTPELLYSLETDTDLVYSGGLGAAFQNQDTGIVWLDSSNSYKSVPGYYFTLNGGNSWSPFDTSSNYYPRSGSHPWKCYDKVHDKFFSASLEEITFDSSGIHTSSAIAKGLPQNTPHTYLVGEVLCQSGAIYLQKMAEGPGTYTGGFWRSTDGGNTFDSVAGPVTEGGLFSVPQSCTGGVVIGLDRTNGIWETTDGGDGKLSDSIVLPDSIAGFASAGDTISLISHCAGLRIPIPLQSYTTDSVRIEAIISSDKLHEFSISGNNDIVLHNGQRDTLWLNYSPHSLPKTSAMKLELATSWHCSDWSEKRTIIVTEAVPSAKIIAPKSLSGSIQITDFGCGIIVDSCQTLVVDTVISSLPKRLRLILPLPDTIAGGTERPANLEFDPTDTSFSAIATVEVKGHFPGTSILFDTILYIDLLADNPSSVADISQRDDSSQQNYPNPVGVSSGFNTTIPFATSAGGVATITVVNEKGVKIINDDEEILGAGNHFFYFSAKDLPTGTYYYTIEFPQGVVIANKTMLVVK